MFGIVPIPIDLVDACWSLGSRNPAAPATELPNKLIPPTAGAASISLVCICAAFLLLQGCSAFTPRPLRGGVAKVTLSSATNAPTLTLTQPENPAQSSSQEIDRTTEETREPITAEPYPPIAATGSPTLSPGAAIPSPAPVKYTLRTTERVRTQLGASQKDSAREIAATLSSMRPVQVAGIILVAAALSMFWGPIRAITQSTTLQVFTAGAGLVLIFLPMIMASNPTLFAIATIAGIALPAGYFFVHRHGQLRGFIDANRNGVDDRKETA